MPIHPDNKARYPKEWPAISKRIRFERAGGRCECEGNPRWVYGIACHALIHGGIVALITGHWWLGALETIAHAAIDETKCRGRIGLTVDQLLHFACKAVWAGIAVALA